ncbi:type IV pilus assembly protein PilM [Patescibacteria group bacterium]|nr:type IV pilus assembly protein PilM [Patescibacteria group bacterium]
MLETGNKNTFGLDFSDNVIRLVQIAKKGKDLQLKAFSEQRITPGLIKEGEILDESKIVEEIKKLLKNTTGNLSGKNIIASLPERKSFIKVIEFPQTPGNLEMKIKKELTNHIPMGLEEMYIDWQELKNPEKNHKIIVSATPKKIATSYTSVLEKSGLNPQALEIESVAITRSLINLYKKSDTANIIIDLGYARSTFILAEHDAVMFITSDTEISGDKMTQAISEKLMLNPNEAEKAKILFGLDNSAGKGEVYQVLKPSIQLLKNRILETIRYYNENFNNPKKISNIIFCGGVAQLKGLIECIAIKPKVKIELQLADPAINFKSTKVKIPAKKFLSFPTAIGLALRGANYND